MNSKEFTKIFNSYLDDLRADFEDAIKHNLEDDRWQVIKDYVLAENSDLARTDNIRYIKLVLEESLVEMTDLIRGLVFTS